MDGNTSSSIKIADVPDKLDVWNLILMSMREASVRLTINNEYTELFPTPIPPWLRPIPVISVCVHM